MRPKMGVDYSKELAEIYNLNLSPLPPNYNLTLTTYLVLECKIILKITSYRSSNHCVNNMHSNIITYSQMYCTDKYPQHSSIIWPVWLNG